MSRYIDADVLIDAIENCSYTTWSKDVNRTWWAQSVKVKDNIVNCIKNTPTADVVEVRHGEWIEQVRDYGKYLVTEGYKCSICGYETMDNDKKYCPNCGAKMDGERKKRWN